MVQIKTGASFKGAPVLCVVSALFCLAKIHGVIAIDLAGHGLVGALPQITQALELQLEQDRVVRLVVARLRALRDQAEDPAVVRILKAGVHIIDFFRLQVLVDARDAVEIIRNIIHGELRRGVYRFGRFFQNAVFVVANIEYLAKGRLPAN